MDNQRIQESLKAAENAHASAVRSWNHHLRGRRVCVLEGSHRAEEAIVEFVTFIGEEVFVRGRLVDEHGRQTDKWIALAPRYLHFLPTNREG